MANRPDPPCWRFRAMAPSEPNQNPIQGEFFSAHLPERFIRESVQNSLDARAGPKPVTVRFTISGSNGAVPGERADRYLTGLQPHFEAVMRAESANAERDSDRRRELQGREALLKGPLPFLVVEDFGTKGLLGDITANDIQARGNDFWGFFRSIGISPKDEDAGGSWGLGKWVFPDASKLNAFLGVTLRAGEQRFLLMGQTMLKLHELGGRKYPPVGFFAAGSDEDDKDWLPMPVESAGLPSDGGGSGEPDAACFVHAALSDFGLRPDGDAGTSVVIPHPMDELTDPTNLARAVIRQYFHPIIAGDLVVEIASPDEPGRRIDAATIVDEAHRTGDGAEDDPEQRAAALIRVIELDKWGQRQEDGLVEADARRSKPAIAPDQVESLRARYREGRRLAFRVWSKVGGKANSFKVFLEGDDSLAGGHDYYVRGHLQIPQMDYLTRHHARALIVVDNTSDLGHLLRDAEGPAHEKWRADAPRLKEKGWPAAAERVREVQNAAARILEALAEKPADVRRDALSDLFPGDTGGRRGPGPGRPRPPPVPPENRFSLRIDRVPGGFRLKPAGNADPSGRTFAVRMAYDVARGTTKTAFSRFDAGFRAGYPDFSLRNGQLHMQSEDCEADVRSENELHLRVRGPDFSLGVTGFDERDLVVKVLPLVGEIAASPEAEARAP
ncbi:hypothetical protein [Candidatus Palauibacter sp.]|uniref:hypothetical protein n=1 Tax=Candidatus Palauibacter sp. TaxID=3101350 RepID=UPI003B01F112